MKKTFSIFLLMYYSLGTICLPMGNFSVLSDIPDMYQHCKETEHHDMNVFDFLTDHFLNLDGVFDKHDNGDDQRPHQPVQYQHHSQTVVFNTTHFPVFVNYYRITKENQLVRSEPFLSSENKSKVFRPPIV